MNTGHPELIGQFVERPTPGTWLCLACDADARARGHSGGSAASVTDRAGHTAWHERPAGSRQPE